MVIIAIYLITGARYLPVNSWLLVNRKTGDDANEKILDSKAFSEADMLKS